MANYIQKPWSLKVVPRSNHGVTYETELHGTLNEVMEVAIAFTACACYEISAVTLVHNPTNTEEEAIINE